MADRYGYQFTKTLAPEIFGLQGYVQVATGIGGITGAQIQQTGTNLPIWMKSLTRSSLGTYILTLTDTWCDFPFIGISLVAAQATSALPIPPGSLGAANALDVQLLGFYPGIQYTGSSNPPTQVTGYANSIVFQLQYPSGVVTGSAGGVTGADAPAWSLMMFDVVASNSRSQ